MTDDGIVILFKAWQSKKNPGGIDVNEAGIETFANLVHPAKQSPLMIVRELERVAEVKFKQFEKQADPNDVTESGTIMEGK